MAEGPKTTESAATSDPEMGESAADLDQQALFPGAPTVASLSDSDVLASLSAWARGFGTDRETLRRVLLERDVEPVAERGGHKLYALRHVYKAWSDGADETDPDKLSAFKRKAWYQGEREKMHLQLERGELVASIEMERTIGQLNQLYVRGLETVQDRIERDAGLTPQQAAVLERHIDRIREELYEEVMSRGADEDEPPAAAAEPAATAQAEAPPAAQSAKPPPAGSSAVDDGVAFLRRSLAAGARPTAELIDDGKKVGLSEATLRRAKAQMGTEVIARRQGRGWVWQLAQDAQDA